MRCCMHMVLDISRNEKPYKQESKKKWKTLNKKPKKEEERNPIVIKKGVPTSENKKNESNQKVRKKERGAHSNENEKLSGKNLTFDIKETLKVILSKSIMKKKKNSTTRFVAESIRKSARSAQKTSFYRFCSDP